MSIRTLPFLFSVVLLGVGCASQHVRPSRAMIGERDRLLAVTNVCTRAPGPITIDGVVEEGEWDGSCVINNFLVPVSWEKPRVGLTAYVTYDATHLYVAFDVLDRDLHAPAAGHDGPLYDGDVVEIFLKPRVRGVRYSEIEISPTGAILDATFWRRRYTPASYTWNCEGLRSAARFVGTLNRSGDTDEGWSAELAIPFATLPDTGGVAPTNGVVWRFTLAGYNFDHTLPGGRELFAHSPLCQNLFRRHEDWRWLRFE